MADQFPDFKQPPWVQSPSEVMDWINATHPSKKAKGKRHGSSGEKVLRNLHVRFDLNVKQKTIPPSNVFSKLITMMTGNGFVEDGFELLPTTEMILRGLAKAKFKNILKIVFDTKTVRQFVQQDLKITAQESHRRHPSDRARSDIVRLTY